MRSILVLLVSIVAAFPSNNYIRHETRHESQRISDVGRRVEPNAILPVRIALTQRNLEYGDEYLLDTSMPSSPNYGRHWTAEQVQDTFAPSPESIRIVSAWLHASGVPREQIHQSDNKVWLAVDLPASQVESLFQTEFYARETGNGKVKVGCDSYSLPHHLVQHVDYIKPGVVSSPLIAKKRLQPSERSLSDVASGLNEALNKHPRSINSRDATENITAEVDQDLATIDADEAAGNTTKADVILDLLSSMIRNGVSTCAHIVTPICIRNLYNISEVTNSANVQSVDALGLLEEDDEFFSQSDFDLFTKSVAPFIPAGTQPEFVLVNNATGLGEPGSGEAMLDYDMIYPIIYPQIVRTFQVVATDEQTEYITDSGTENALLDAIDGSYCTPADVQSGANCGTVNLTRVLSISYGGQELEVSEKRAQAACAEIMKLSLQGHTIVEASGDYGVTGQVQSCVDPNNITASAGGDTSGNGTVFNTDFWSSCPYILSVGGSQLNPGQSVTDIEVSMGGTDDTPVASRFGSTGGFSNYNARPAYQDDAVNAYFENYDPGYPTYDFQANQSIGADGGIYNRPGRGFPDISANGNNIFVVANGTATLSGGTSAAAPIVASIITLINQERTVIGKGPVGFVNPVLYQHPEAFNDVTDGNNPGCYTGGFSAVPGWDPVTGLGTPNYPKLLEMFLNLP